MAERFVESASLLFVILNPFLLAIYLQDVLAKLDLRKTVLLLLRACLISGGVFSAFAVTGDAIFRDVLHVRFASFAIFGGLIFLVIGIRFVLLGPGVIQELRGPPAQVAGSIAMPFMVGPGTVNASVLAGARLPPWLAVAAIAAALVVTLLVIVALKFVHDHVRKRYTGLVDRYVEVVGRVSALVMGTFAVEMILQGIDLWRQSM